MSDFNVDAEIDAMVPLDALSRDFKPWSRHASTGRSATRKLFAASWLRLVEFADGERATLHDSQLRSKMMLGLVLVTASGAAAYGAVFVVLALLTV